MTETTRPSAPPAMTSAGLATGPSALWSRLRLMLGEASDRDRTRRDAMAAFFVRVASAALLYISQVLLARWMGAHDYGIYVIVWTWVLVLGGTLHLGFATTMMRLVPEYRERNDADLLRGLLLAGRGVGFACATLFMVAGLAVLHFFPSVIQKDYLLPAFIILFCLPSYTLCDIQDGIGRSRGWMAIGLVPPYILRPVLLLIVIVAGHALGWPTTAATAAGAAVIATWGAALIQTALLEVRLRREIPAGPRAYDFRAWFATALPLLAVYACEMTLQNIDVVVVSAIMTPVDVGMYFAAGKTMSLVMFVHYAVGSAFANRFSSLNARGDRQQLQAFVRDAVNWTFWPSLAAGVVLLALGKPLLWLFCPEFTQAYAVMVILAVGFMVRSAVGPADFLLNMMGEQRRCAAVLALSAAISIGLNIVLVPRFGLLGAASATAAAISFAAIANYGVARRYLGLDMGIWSNFSARAA